MGLTREERVLTATFAARDAAPTNTPATRKELIEDFWDFVASLEAQTRTELPLELQQYSTPRLLRAYSRNGSSDRQDKKTFHVEMDQDGIWRCNGETIGRRWILYKAVQPYEAQSRVAYDVFFQTMFDTLARQHRIAALGANNYTVELFVPVQFDGDIEQLWEALIAELYSAKNLGQTFIALMKSVRLTNRGFSAIDMPILTKDQALILAGFDLVNLRSLMNGDNSRKRQIAKQERKLADPELNDKDRQSAQKQLIGIEKELQTRLQRYAPMYEQWQVLQEETPEWAQAVLRAERQYHTGAEQPLAGQQIAKAGAKIGKAVQQIADLQALVAEERYATLEPLLSAAPIASPVTPGGDGNTKICYGCGRAIPKGAPAYQANTFIFAAPSQRLQSGGSQKQPNVCQSCAAVAFVSPIKLGEGRLVLRLRRIDGSDSHSHMVNDQLRMFKLGDQDIVAGRYAMLQTPETIGNDLLIDKLGGVQYALYKIASIFTSTTVFKEYGPEIIIGETSIRLPPRRVIWMQQLISIFGLKRKWNDKQQFSALGRAIRYVEKDNIVFAIYELLRTGVVNNDRISATQLMLLEQLRESHWEELVEGKKQAQFYRDVAAMTGLHYAFCSLIQSRVAAREGSTPTKERIEVNKAIERINRPFDFSYTEAGNTESFTANLFLHPSTYFIYKCAKKLLSDIKVNPEERINTASSGESMRFYVDDIINAHTFLVGDRYISEQAQREFFYALKLSLYARFPKFIKPTKKENE